MKQNEGYAMNHFFAYISFNGRIDSRTIRAWIDDAKAADIMLNNPDVSIIRIASNQIAVLLPETDRVLWLDIQDQDLDILKLKTSKFYKNSAS
jgi:hypothetical protein